jgi:DNA-binding response OmpR family regulator
MENQLGLTTFPSDKDDQEHSDRLDQAWWEEFGECLDLGLFFISGQDKPVYLNPLLRSWLGIGSESVKDEQEFWERISSLVMDPTLVRREKKIIQDGYHGNRLIQFPLRNDKETLLTIHLFSLTDPIKLERPLGGLVSKGAESNRLMTDLVRIFENLLVPARQLAAAIQGNLQALSVNFQTWSPEVLEQFLDSARGDIRQMRQFLDLGLSYSKVINQTSTFSQPVPFIVLLEKIVEEHGFTTVNVSEPQVDGEGPLLAKINEAMVKIALETLLKEVVAQNPPGQQLELRLSEREGFVLLNLDSPRMLPLPGLGVDNPGKEIQDLNPELILAKEILIAQGGNLIIESRFANEGGGLDIEVALPVAEPYQHRPIRPEWRDVFETKSARILLAEDQPDYQLRIRDALTDLGHRVDLAVDGSTVLDLIQTRQPHLVILARNLPGMDGLLVTQGVRRWSSVPIIMISMRDNVEDLLYAYRLGVDDYLSKPFLIEELLAKVQVFLSRQEATQRSIAPEIYQEGSIRIDHGTRQVWVRGALVQLTPIEYNLLIYLSRQGRQIMPYEQLLEHVWEGPEKGTRQGLFVHVRRLREKIEEDPKNPLILSNKWGVGYVFNP